MKFLVASTLALAFTTFVAASVSAQVVRDGTVGPDSSVQPVGPDFELPDSFGERHGVNLFHSFSQFDLSASESATFTGNGTIENVISRVTGPGESTIGGLIRSRIPGASLFLMNPHGVTFTETAELDVDGSFNATTADYLEFGFDENARFFADPDRNSVFSPIDVSAFGFLTQEPGAINVNESVLVVPDSEELLLVGGDLTIRGRSLDASFDRPQLGAVGGRIGIVSLASPGEVDRIDATPSLVNPPEDTGGLGTVHIKDRAILNVGGEAGGTLLVRAGDLIVEGNTLVNSGVLGALDGAPSGIDIEAANRVEVLDSQILSDSFGSGKSGSIRIRTETLELTGEIGARSFGPARSGDIEIVANRVLVLGGSITTDAGAGGGDGGNLQITAHRLEGSDLPSLEVTGGGTISASTFGSGDTGSMTIVADDVLLQGGSGADTGLFMVGNGTGRQTGFSLRAGDLQIIDGAEIDLARLQPGDGGSHEIQAETIRVGSLDSPAGSPSSKIDASIGPAFTGGTAPALTIQAGDLLLENFGQVSATTSAPLSPGKLTIRADRLKAHSRAQIFSGTFSAGDGGPIDIRADAIELTGSSFISSRGAALSSGSGGSIDIEASSILLDGRSAISGGSVGSGGGAHIHLDIGSGTLQVLGGSSVLSVVFGAEPGGDVVVNGSGKITVAGADLTPGAPLMSAIGTQTASTEPAGGDAGNVRITADTVELLDAGAILTETFGTGKAGDLEIDARRILVSGVNQGWKLALNPDPDADPVAAHSRISTSSQPLLLDFQQQGGTGPEGAGDAGMVRITADVLEVAEGGDIDSDTLTTGNAGDIVISANRISLSGDATINSRSRFVQNAGAAGDLHISARDLLDIQTSSVTSTSENGASGSISISDTGTVKLRDGGTITTSSKGTANAGSISIGPGTRDVVLSGGRILTTAAFGFEEETGRQGNISIEASGLVLLEKGQPGVDPSHQSGQSEISVSVDEGLGGNITIAAPEQLVLRDSSAILAETDAGTGGAIRITADAVLLEPESTISADAGVGTDGLVIVNSPEVNVEAGITTLPTDFLNASALMRPACAARSAGSREGSFVVANRRGIPASPEGLLLAFDSVDYGDVAAAAEEQELPPVAGTPPLEASVHTAQVALAQGSTAFRGGHFEQATRHWSEASELYAGIGDSDSRSDALRSLAQTQQALGRYDESLEPLRGALALAEGSGDRARTASALGSLGNTYVALEQPRLAEDFLKRGIALAKDAGENEIAGAILNNLGNLRFSLESYSSALEAYQEGARLARESGDRVEEAKALSNGARAALRAGRSDLAETLVDEAHAAIEAMSGTHEKAYVLIHTARTDRALAMEADERRARFLLRAHSSLTAALELAEDLSDFRAASYALGNLGSLYQGQHRYPEALYITRRAISAAEKANAPESIYRWYWQAGKILEALGRTGDSIDAYRRAVATVRETRQETALSYLRSEASFRDAVGPVYLDLVDALLSASDLPVESDVSHALLVEARETIEELKAAELRDYFRDECVADLEARAIPLEAISPRAAIVYPILLPDRTEILLSVPSGLKRYTVAVGSAELTGKIRAFRSRLERADSGDHSTLGRQLYDHLVRPYEPQLSEEQIDTLVFVLGGPLRTIPMSALHDGEHFLIRSYSVAVTPGLALTDPKPLDRANTRILLAGLSEPVQGFPPLPSVPGELEAIQALYGGEKLLDDEFTLTRIEETMRDRELSIVHLASHGTFTGDPESSFILAYDGQLSMDRINEYVGVARFRDAPLELLVLSACQTASGDDRAALGLAGIAIRAGARSAIGSLWSISDEATAQLVKEFYKALRDRSLSKADALRQAQLKLIDGGRFPHPSYWSPFLLISNWL
jgi:filamentous hemagglutinin family protein